MICIGVRVCGRHARSQASERLLPSGVERGRTSAVPQSPLAVRANERIRRTFAVRYLSTLLPILRKVINFRCDRGLDFAQERGSAMSEIEWTTESVIRLMEEYRQRPELWDTGNELYRVQTAKYEAWFDLSRVFQCDIADLRKKLNSIFASHRREKAKIRAGGKSTWFLYPYMSFLPNHLENDRHTEVIKGTKNYERPSQSEQSEQSSDSDDNNEHDNDNRQEIDVNIKEEPVADVYAKDKRKTIKRTRLIKTSARPSKPLLKRRIVKEKENSCTTSLDNRLLETLKLLRKSDLSKKKDECDSFGEYIAISLRKHDERTQSMIKQAINNILFEQEMKKYSTGQYTVVISGIDENPLVLGDDK